MMKIHHLLLGTSLCLGLMSSTTAFADIGLGNSGDERCQNYIQGDACDTLTEANCNGSYRKKSSNDYRFCRFNNNSGKCESQGRCDL